MSQPQRPEPVPMANKAAIELASQTVLKQLSNTTSGEKKDSSGRTARERHIQRRDWYLGEASRQAQNRAMMAKCEAFYDGEQITHEDAQKLRDRGQNPVVYNEVFYIVNWLIGTERKSRVDFFVVADGDEEQDADDATAKTKLMKYLDDVNRAPFERSYAAADAFKAGMGWLEVGLRGDHTGIPIYVGAESWRNMLWDSKSRKMDLSDARYFFRVKTLDLDVAIAMLPDDEAKLRAAATVGDRMEGIFGTDGVVAGSLNAFDRMDGQDDINSVSVVDVYNPRERVTIIECWSREPVRRSELKEGDQGYGLGDPLAFRMRCSLMTELDTLVEAWSPFKHDGPPFIPIWAYRNARTGLPYGPIRQLLGPQEALNHRMSKSLYEASARQMEIEKGAIDPEGMDIEELREEWNAPDGVAVYADGAISGGKVRQMDNQGAASQQLVLAERDISTIRHMSGIDAAAQGLKSNLTSGVALKTNNENTTLLTMELFDNLLLGRQMEGDLTLSLAENHVKQPITARVAGEGQSQGERIKFNQPDGWDMDPETGEPVPRYLNDLSARRAHFVVGEQAWKQSFAESSFESLMNVLTQMASAAPQVVIGLLDVVFEMHPNLPRKKAMLERTRKINGMSDPDGKMTPEQQAEAQQKAAIAKAQFEAQMAQLAADIKEARSKGEKLDAEAMNTRVTALYEAAQTAAVLIQSPGLSPVADQILASAGFKDLNGSPQTIGPVAAQPAPVPQPGQPPQQAAPPLPELQQADGAQQGIETPANDGPVIQQ